MGKNDGISMPAGFGGLKWFSEEYPSKLMLDPKHVIIFIIAIIIFVLGLKIFFPIA